MCGTSVVKFNSVAARTLLSPFPELKVQGKGKYYSKEECVTQAEHMRRKTKAAEENRDNFTSEGAAGS